MADFEHNHLEDAKPSPDFVSSDNLAQSSKNIIVGAQDRFTHIDPNFGVGLNRKAEAGATMVSMGQYYAVLYANGSISAAPSIDWARSNVHSLAATGNLTFTMINPKIGGRYVLEVLQDESGSRTYTWPSAVKWSNGTAPTGSGSGKYDIFSFIYDGTYYFGASSLNY